MSSARYQDGRLVDRLAREYVIGTMQGGARRRFEGLLAASPLARRSVAEWEGRLAPLARSVAPVEVPGEAWHRIAARLGFEQPKPARGGGVWMGIAAALAIATLTLSLLYLDQARRVSTPDYVAVVTDAEIGPVWVVQAFGEPGELRATVVTERPLADDSDYELWMLPDDGSAPVSLGVIARTGETVLMLDLNQLGTLGQTSMLAVSIEPAGGSPVGTPTGPVIYSVPLLAT